MPEIPLPIGPIPPVTPFHLGSVGSGLTRDAVTGVMDAFTAGLEHGATWLVGQIQALLLPPVHVADPASIHLDSTWFVHEIDVMLRVMLGMVLPLLLAATIGAVLRQDMRRLLRIWLVSLPLAIVGTFVAVQLSAVLVNGVNDLSTLMIGSDASDLQRALGRMVADSTVPGAGAVTALVDLVILAGALLLWLELILRAAVVYLVVFFLPLGLAAMIWPATAHLTRRMIETLVAVIVSKFVIVAALALGASAVLGGGPDTSGLIGGAMLLLAAFAPFTLLKLIPIMEGAAIAHLEGTARRPARAAARAAGAAGRAPSHPVAALLRSRAGAGGDGGSAANDASQPGRTSAPARPLRDLHGWATVDGEPIAADPGRSAAPATSSAGADGGAAAAGAVGGAEAAGGGGQPVGSASPSHVADPVPSSADGWSSSSRLRSAEVWTLTAGPPGRTDHPGGAS